MELFLIAVVVASTAASMCRRLLLLYATNASGKRNLILLFFFVLSIAFFVATGDAVQEKLRLEALLDDRIEIYKEIREQRDAVNAKIAPYVESCDILPVVSGEVCDVYHKYNCPEFQSMLKSTEPISYAITFPGGTELAFPNADPCAICHE